MKNMIKAAIIAATFFLTAAAAQAAPIYYFSHLSGPSESPANTSPGIGATIVIYDPAVHQLSVQVNFLGLTGNTTASHIHCCTAVPFTANVGVATQTPTFGGFPLGVTSGTYTNVFNLTLAASWNTPFITANGSIAGAEAAFAAGLAGGTTYLNIHSSAFPGGEIRGFLQAPEPASLALIAVGLSGLAFSRRHSKG